MKDTFRVVFDDDDANSPGWKFAEWEMRGVPVRIEIGPRDMENGKAMLVRRDTGEKESVAIGNVVERVAQLLKDIQQSLYNTARELREKNTHRIDDYVEFKKLYAEDGGFIDTYWCGSAECEAAVKEDTKATIRVLPFEQGDLEGKRCVRCGEPAKYRAVFAKAY